MAGEERSPIKGPRRQASGIRPPDARERLKDEARELIGRGGTGTPPERQSGVAQRGGGESARPTIPVEGQRRVEPEPRRSQEYEDIFDMIEEFDGEYDKGDLREAADKRAYLLEQLLSAQADIIAEQNDEDPDEVLEKLKEKYDGVDSLDELTRKLAVKIRYSRDSDEYEDDGEKEDDDGGGDNQSASAMAARLRAMRDGRGQSASAPPQRGPLVALGGGGMDRVTSLGSVSGGSGSGGDDERGGGGDELEVQGEQARSPRRVQGNISQRLYRFARSRAGLVTLAVAVGLPTAYFGYNALSGSGAQPGIAIDGIGDIGAVGEGDADTEVGGLVVSYETGSLRGLGNEFRHNIQTFIDAVNESDSVQANGGLIRVDAGQSVNVLELAGISTLEGFYAQGFQPVFSPEDVGFGVFVPVTALQIGLARVDGLQYSAGLSASHHRDYAALFASPENGYNVAQASEQVRATFITDPNQHPVITNTSEDQAYGVRLEYLTEDVGGQQVLDRVRVTVRQLDAVASGGGL